MDAAYNNNYWFYHATFFKFRFVDLHCHFAPEYIAIWKIKRVYDIIDVVEVMAYLFIIYPGCINNLIISH